MLRGLAAIALTAPAANCSGRSGPVASTRSIFRAVGRSLVGFERKKPGDAYDWDGAFGSGFVIASGTWGSRFVTAAFVVHGAYNFQVAVAGRRHVAATVVATDRRNRLAILEIDLPGVPLASVPGLNGSGGRPVPFRAGGGQERGVGVTGLDAPDPNAAAFPPRFAGEFGVLAAGKDGLRLDHPFPESVQGGAVVSLGGGVIGVAATSNLANGANGLAWALDPDALAFLRRNAAPRS